MKRDEGGCNVLPAAPPSHVRGEIKVKLLLFARFVWIAHNNNKSGNCFLSYIVDYIHKIEDII